MVNFSIFFFGEFLKESLKKNLRIYFLTISSKNLWKKNHNGNPEGFRDGVSLRKSLGKFLKGWWEIPEKKNSAETLQQIPEEILFRKVGEIAHGCPGGIWEEIIQCNIEKLINLWWNAIEIPGGIIDENFGGK